MMRSTLALLLTHALWSVSCSVQPVQTGCSTNTDCSLNGVCTGSTCVCDKPWSVFSLSSVTDFASHFCGELLYKAFVFRRSGLRCGVMQYAVTPAAGKDLYDISDPRNTWNGPIVRDSEGKFHMYNPLYNISSLGGPLFVMHGLADDVYGPWDWHSLPPVCEHCGENPAALVYKEHGESVYTIWLRGHVWTSHSAHGPFTETDFKYVGGNPAPIWHNGAFYLTNQATTAIYTTPSLDPEQGNWTVFASVDHSNVPQGAKPEDPYLWIDKRGNWHIINHAYDITQFENCAKSILSTHFYSEDGKRWRCADDEPYGHTVRFDDGTNHTYTTLERPNIHFDAAGQMTHLGLAADLVTGDEGCADRPWRGGGQTACTNCKYTDHAGTLLVKLVY